jgi:hypothetical protein
MRVVAGLAFWSLLGPGRAQETVVMAWDCWVDDSARIVEIRCIHDRDGNVVDEEISREQREILLDHIHRMIHGGNGEGLDSLVAHNWHVLNDDDLWSIVIFSPPYPSSWEEQRPKKLVRSLLCPGSVECEIFMREPDGVPP